MRTGTILQLAGWGCVAAIDYALNPGDYPSAPRAWAAYAALSLGGLGCTVSAALHLVYRKLRHWTGWRSALLLGFGGVAGTFTWYVTNHLLDEIVGYPDRQSLVEGLFGKGMLLLFVMLAWHASVAAMFARTRALEAERLAKEAQLGALRYQLNPHFLFNSLNSAIALIDESPARAQEMLTRLAGLLRATLQGEASSEIRLDKEMDLVTRYLDIQRIRFEERLVVETSVPVAAQGRAIPPLLVHSLVENAVKHGMRSAQQGPLRVAVQATYDGKSLRVVVRNTGTLGPARQDGVGLRNIEERLAVLYPGRHRFHIEEDAGTVEAVVEIQSPRLL